MGNLRQEQFYRYRQYARMALRHLTPRKLANILRVEWRLRRGNPDVRGLHPYLLFADMAPGCNLRCPLCFTGQGILRTRQQRMTLENYRKTVGPAAPWLSQVFFYNNGEPFLNPAVYDIIAWTSSRNIATMASSNLSLPIDAERLVASGLEYLVISADGVTQEVYEQYRVGGRLETVTENIKAIAAARKRARSPYPVMEWQYLVTRKNEHQVPEVPGYAGSLGVNTVRFANLNFFAVKPEQRTSMEAEWLPRDPSFNAFADERKPGPDARRRPCYWLWRTAVISCDGAVLPCCLYDTDSWGNAVDTPLEEIWNGPAYSRARRLHRPGAPDGPAVICDSCRAPFLYR